MSRSLDPLRQPLTGRCLIEASAGTGKTYAITSLYLRLLLGHDGRRTGVQPLDISQILVVTFTRAATEELRGRLRGRIVEARRAFESGVAPDGDTVITGLLADSHNPAEDLKRLELAEVSLDLASVFTIHGFAQRMLELNAFESGASFAMRISEDDSLIVAQSALDFWRERVYPLSQFAGERLADILPQKRFLAELRSLLPRSGLVLEGAPAADWTQLLGDIASAESALLATLRSDRLAIKATLDAVSLKAKEGAPVRAALHALSREPRPDRLHAVVVEGLSTTTLDAAITVRSRHALEPHPVFGIAERLMGLARDLAHRLLHDAVFELRSRLATQKARSGALGFDDLLRLLDEGLSGAGGERLAQAIRKRYPAALIDECQDTDPVQWRIFDRVYDQPGTSLFLVGDPKQAIYGFRGADVYAYLAARREARDAANLDTNYRSVRPLVSALNTLFRLRADGDPFNARDIPYVEVKPSGRHDDEALLLDGEVVPALQLLPFSVAGAISKGELNSHMARAAADAIAQMLLQSRHGELTLGGLPLKPGHIACLVRDRHEAEALARELRRRGVPHVYRGRENVFQSTVAADLHRLLLAVLEPRAESRLRTALASGILARSAAELAQWISDEAEMAHWQERFMAARERLREQGVQAMFRGLLFELGAPARLLALPDGERRLTDCLHLVELLTEERDGLDSDEALATRFAELMVDAGSEQEARLLRLESDADRVRIVTIHASKGLEYPFVFMPFVASGKTSKSALYHDAETLEPRYDLSHGDSARAAAAAEQLAEELRLLYVGLTRAVHGCVIGVADVIDGRTKKQILGDSAIGWLLDVEGLGVERALERLQQACGAVEMSPLAFTSLAGLAPAGPQLAARRFTARIERDWRASSYSALVRHHAVEREERVYSQPELLQREPVPEPGEGFTRAGFPRGPDYGNLLHGLLEHIDPAQPALAPGNEALIRAALTRQQMSGAWRPVVAEFVDELRQCALDDRNLRLAAIPAEARVAELDFELPFGRITAQQLNTLLCAYEPLAARARSPLAFAEMRGMLSGSIDLLFEHDGRYFVADYKSNYLGPAFTDYGRESMEHAIVTHRYDLQYTLYTLALVRLLRARLGDSFDYERHVGGVYYLFLRGIRASTGSASGVFFTRPQRSLIEALDSLFAEVVP